MFAKAPLLSAILLSTFSLLCVGLRAQSGKLPAPEKPEAAGGQLLLSGSVAFESSYRTCPGCTGFFWKESAEGTDKELLPEEAARKQFTRRVGRITVMGPGHLLVLPRRYTTGSKAYPRAQIQLYTYPADTPIEANRLLSKDEFLRAFPPGSVSPEDPSYSFPAETLQELEVVVEMRSHPNHPEPGHLEYPGPQGLQYEIWYIPGLGGKVIEVINHHQPIETPLDHARAIQIFTNSGTENLLVQTGLTYQFNEPGLMKLPDGSFLVSRTGKTKVEVLNWQAGSKEDLLDLLVQHAGHPLSLFTPYRNNPQTVQVTWITPPAAVPGDGELCGLFLRDGRVQPARLTEAELPALLANRAANHLLTTVPLSGAPPLDGGQLSRLNWPAVFERANQAPLIYSIRNRRNGGGKKKLSYSLRLAPGTLASFSTRVKARLDFDLALLTPRIMDATRNTPLAIGETNYFLPDQNMTLFSLAPGVPFSELIKTIREKGSGLHSSDHLFTYQWRIISSGVWLSYDEDITFAAVQSGRFDRLHHRTEERLTITEGKSAFLCPQSVFRLQPFSHWTGLSLEQCPR